MHLLSRIPTRRRILVGSLGAGLILLAIFFAVQAQGVPGGNFEWIRTANARAAELAACGYEGCACGPTEGLCLEECVRAPSGLLFPTGRVCCYTDRCVKALN